MDPELEALLRNVRSSIIGCGQKLIVKARSSGRPWCNTLPVVKEAFGLMKSLELVVVPNDKDGGFCCIARCVFLSMREKLLSSHWYQEVDPMDTNGDALR